MLSPSYWPGTVLGEEEIVMHIHSLCPLGAFKTVAVTTGDPPISISYSHFS